MAKVKRMMFGGAAKAVTGALDSVKKAVAAKAAPMKSGPTNPNAVKPTASPVKGQGVTGGPRPGAVNANPPAQGIRQLTKGATMAVPARGISRGDLKMAGLMKKGGAVKKKATKK